MEQNPFVLVFTAVYLFAFREATKIAGGWGAFQWRTSALFWKKIVFFSFTLLVLVPMICYIPFSKLVATFSLGGSTTPLLLENLTWTVLTLLVLGLFPRAPKHLWSLIAKHKLSTKGGDGLIRLEKVDNLPHNFYSYQVLVVLGILPLTIYFISGWWFSGIPPYPIAVEDFAVLFVVIY